MKTDKLCYWLMSAAFFTFFLTWSFSFSLFSIWLDQIVHLTGEKIGFVFGINALVALFIMPFYGFMQDKLGLKKHLLYVIGIALICMGPFFIYVYGPLLNSHFYTATILGAFIFAIAFSAGIGVLETYVERVGRTIGFEFGKARMWGSLGWALATFFAGALLNLNPQYNFWLSSVCGFIFFTIIYFVQISTKQNVQALSEQQDTPNFKEILTLFVQPNFWKLVFFVMGVSCIYMVYDQQFPIYFSSLFSTKAEGNLVYGYLNSFQVFLEAGVMFIAPFIVNKIGAKNGLILSGVFMAVRMVGSGYAEGHVFISLMKLLHAIELPILIVALFKYIAANFDQRLSSTIYLVGFLVFTQLGAALISVGIGMLYDTIGFSASYKILGCIVIVCTLISYFLLSNSQQTLKYNSDKSSLLQES
ncbi:MAG: MFS transporter [Thalassotalea sp.]|nr:MFS transporter [Thalassotalea sp.]